MINYYHWPFWIGKQKNIPVPQPEIYRLCFYLHLPWPAFFLFSLRPLSSSSSSWKTIFFFLFFLNLIHCHTLFLCSNICYLAFSLVAISELKMDRICLIGQTLQALNSAWQVYYLFYSTFFLKWPQLSSNFRSSSLYPCSWQMISHIFAKKIGLKDELPQLQTSKSAKLYLYMSSLLLLLLQCGSFLLPEGNPCICVLAPSFSGRFL